MTSHALLSSSLTPSERPRMLLTHLMPILELLPWRVKDCTVTAISQVLLLLPRFAICVPFYTLTSLCRRMLKQERHGLSVVRPPDRFRQRGGNVDGMNAITQGLLLLVWNRVGHNQLLQLATIELLDRIS